MKRVVCFAVFLCMVLSITAYASDYSNIHINSGDLKNDLIEVAKTQIGYCELTQKGGEEIVDSEIPGYTKYGEKYGNSYGHWCAFFVLWCASEADIPTSIIPKSAENGSCRQFVNWFKSNKCWEDADYEPKMGDIIFFDWNGDGVANHVGIVKSYENGIVTTIEGNTGGENGYTVMEQERCENILGYGVPNYDLKEKINGYANKRQTAYMLPDETSQSVWEVWKGDELIILCEDGDFYLVMYPYAYTGKFVTAYVPKNAVDVCGNVLPKSDCYNINKQSVCLGDVVVYHSIDGENFDGGTRGSLEKGDSVTVLFEDGEYFFVQRDNLSGYVEKIKIKYENYLKGDINEDNKINSADAGLILRYDAGIIKLNESELKRGDVNGDGIVNSADAGLILRYDAGVISNIN